MPGWVPDQENEHGVLTETEKKVEKPPRYKVLLHNDDFTTQQFVVLILQSVFNKGFMEAIRIMLAVHHQGVGVAGVYTYEVAEAKVNKVIELARAEQYPLLCTMEEE